MAAGGEETTERLPVAAPPAIGDVPLRARVLGALLPFIKPAEREEIAKQALLLASSIDDPEARALALLGVAAAVPSRRAQLIADTVPLVRRLTSPLERSQALALLASHLEPQAGAALLLEAFETACSIDYEDDAAALHAVYAQFLPEDFFDRADGSLKLPP